MSDCKHLCGSEKKQLSTRGSCAANHAWPTKSCLLIREACTHYSPVSSAGATETCYSLRDKRRGEMGSMCICVLGLMFGAEYTIMCENGESEAK